MLEIRVPQFLKLSNMTILGLDQVSQDHPTILDLFFQGECGSLGGG
jgi:hypothetical protein